MNNRVNNLNKYIKVNPDTTKYIIYTLIGLCLILFIVFADFTVSTGSNNNSSNNNLKSVNNKLNNNSSNNNSKSANNKNKDMNKSASNNNINKLGKSNPANEALGAPFNFPHPDNYMSDDLREQIETLRNKFYYDNCKYGSLL